MRLGAVGQRLSPANRADRRLVAGVLISLLLHGLVLSLQFGIPALGLPGSATPIQVRLADAVTPSVDPAPAPTPLESPPLPPLPPVPDAAVAVRPSGGMRLVDPAPQPPPVPIPATPRLAVKKDKPRKAKRISPPLPASDALAMDTRVIAQDATLNDFVVPMPRPEEAEQKTIDLKEAQHGTDDGTEATSAAAEAEAARAAQRADTARQEEEAARLAAQIKLEQEAEARKMAELQARQQQEKASAAAALEEEKQARLAQAREQADEQARRQAALLAQQAEADAARERATLRKAEQLALQQRADQQKLEQQKQDQLRAEQLKAEQLAEQRTAEQLKAAQQKTEQLVAQQKAEQLAAQQKAEQLAVQQKAEQLAAQQKAEQLAAQQKAEQLAAQQKAEQLAAQQKAEQLAAQKLAEQQAAQQAAQKLAEQQAANQAAQQAAQKQAAQQAAQQAALQRGRDGGGTQADNTPPGGTAAGAGAGAGGKITVPKNMLGSDLGNRARELVKGLDLLSGQPPPTTRDERRIAVGAGERDLPLRMYAESWRQKIERNGGPNYPRSWADIDRTDPLVSVAVRSDGTVQDVTILRSSGRADMDEAVRRIVRVNARYSPFPPNIAARYDVIDIRRVWRFDESLKLLEELR